MSPAYVAIQFTPSTSFTATRLEIFSGEASGASSLQLWAQNPTNNQPLAALGAGAFTLAAPVDWQGANLAAPVALTAGQTYWLVWSTVNGCQSPVDLAMATLGQPYRVSFDSGQTWSSTLYQFADRHWKFRIFGSCSATASYCTAGLTTHGCTPAITSSGAASASATSGFTVQIDSVEGQRNGIVFYGLDNTGFTPLPWGQGSTSFFCVKSPTQRTLLLVSGGTNGQCDGQLAFDWNAYRASTPGILGAPFSGGETLYLQGWFRDPGAPRNTNLSDGLSTFVAP